MITSLNDLKEIVIQGEDGKIGYLRDFYFDNQTWVARYAIVRLLEDLGERDVLLATSTFSKTDLLEQVLHTDLSREKVANSPEIDASRPMSRQEEEDLSGYYLWPKYWIPTTGFGLGVGDLSAVPMVDLEADLQEQQEREQAENDPESHLYSTGTLKGFHILSNQDEDIGVVEDFLIDDRRWDIPFIVTDIGNWADIRNILLPTEWVNRFSRAQSIVFLNLNKEVIRTSPEFESGIDEDYFRRVTEHYAQDDEMWKSPGDEG